MEKFISQLISRIESGLTPVCSFMTEEWTNPRDGEKRARITVEHPTISGWIHLEEQSWSVLLDCNLTDKDGNDFLSMNLVFQGNNATGFMKGIESMIKLFQYQLR